MTQRNASKRFDLPQPFGPTTPVSPSAINRSVGSTKLLKPVNLSLENCKGTSGGMIPSDKKCDGRLCGLSMQNPCIWRSKGSYPQDMRKIPIILGHCPPTVEDVAGENNAP